MFIMKFLNVLIIFMFISSCASFDKPTKLHGIKNIDLKLSKIKIDYSNKNDVLKIMGYQPLIDPFDNNLWSYYEIVIEKSKLGKNKFKKNNVISIKFNSKGIVKMINNYDLNDMQNVKFSEKKTKSFALDESVITKILNSSRKRLERSKNKDDNFTPFPK